MFKIYRVLNSTHIFQDGEKLDNRPTQLAKTDV